MDPDLRIGVVGATGAVGRVTLDLLAERGHRNVRAFASSRSAGSTIGSVRVEEATPAALARDDLDVALFSVGTALSRELVPPTAGGGTICIDKSSAYRLQDGVPLVVPEVNGDRALEHTGIVANPNCCAIPLSIVLAPLHAAVGLRAVRVATYQSVSGAGAAAIEKLRAEAPDEHRLRMDWDYDGTEFDEEVKLREETRKILELPDLRLSASCVRVPVVVGHAQSVWIETDEPLSIDEATRVLESAPGVQLTEIPSHADAVGADHVVAGRIRRDPASENGLTLFLVCDNLRKGAALNAIQIAEQVVGATVSS